MGYTDKAGLNHEEARTMKQKELMAKIEEDGVCPFCADHFRQYHPKPIIKETDYWFFTENMSPYEGTIHHFLIVYKPEHVNMPNELAPEAHADLFDLVNWATKEYDIVGGSLFMRFGNGSYNGSSVKHLHAQLLTGIQKGDDTEGIKVKLGYKKV
jgi:diadenosine tetraphosphate (Ap4A) HIT family hydrolase